MNNTTKEIFKSLIMLFFFISSMIIIYNSETQERCYVLHYEDSNIYYAKILPEKAFHDRIDKMAQDNRTFINSNFTFQYWECEKIEKKINKTIPKSGLVFKWSSQ